VTSVSRLIADENAAAISELYPAARKDLRV
jgi:hypothetical protein